MTTHKSNSEPVFLWLRRDLRLHDNAALEAAAKEGPVQPVFIFDPDILERFTNPEDRRLSFIADALAGLQSQLKKHGAELLVIRGRPEEIWPKLARNRPVFCNEDYEPSAIARDKAVHKLLADRFYWFADHLLVSPLDNLKNDGTPFKVFTPFYKQWQKRLAETGVDAYASTKNWYQGKLPLQGLPLEPETMLKQLGYRYAKLTEWKTLLATEQLELFAEEKVRTYKNARDVMGHDGTSRISPYLRFGLVSVRECVRAVRERAGGDFWIRELAWRDFYAMILYHFPHTVERAFNDKFTRIEWSKNKDHFKRFTEGMTGYPVVDAAMRQLTETGWMHNRARMIVASFMSKDLQLDWRWGEEHFAQWLMDYEQATNVGSWQWAASTGTDAQPWFRVFNPVLQGQKFDPTGEYVRRFVPELAKLSNKEIHEPWKYGGAKGYPAPIVDHKVAREAAIAMYRRARE